jgi:hypothetical protein
VSTLRFGVGGRFEGVVALRALVCVSVILTLAAAAGCARAAANPRTDPAPLAVPEPPPRVIEPLPEVEELPMIEPERREAPMPLPRPARPAKDNGSTRAEPKPEPAKPPEVPIEPPAPVPVPAAPRAELRTPEVADDLAVREILDRAAKTLAKVDYRSLGKEAREQYDTAKRFMEQADEALRARNHIAAKYLAEKADTIAKGLTGR